MHPTGLDSEGYILSEVAKENIAPAYMRVIETAIAAMSSRLPNLVHSVYVYGSVARGNPVKGKSDLDLLAVFTRKLTEDERRTLDATLNELSETHRALVREVGVADCTYDEMLDPKNLNGWGAYLKILCVCVFGDDLTQRFGKFKPSAEIARGFNGDIKQSLQATVDKVKQAETDEAAGKLAAVFARKLIRTCYSMVLERSKMWTTKLNEQAELFVQYFPDKQKFIRTLLDWIEQPPQDRQAALAVLEDQGWWVAAHFEAEAKATE